MRALITTQPGLGHLHSLVPIAQALQQAGHDVAFACARSFCPRVEAAGFHGFPAGLDWLEAHAEQAFPELRGGLLDQRPNWFLTEVFADIAAHRMVPDLLTICRSWQPDVIVRNEVEFGACIVSELLGIPEATVSIEFFTPARLWKELIGDQLAYLRSAFGLPPYEIEQMLYSFLYLSCMPPSLQFPEFSLPPSVHAVRPLAFDRSGDEVLPDWVSRMPPRPTVYVTLGTVFNRAAEVFQTIIDGLRDEPLNLIVTLGHGQDTEQFGRQPDNVHIERYIPQSLLLPSCDLAIIHGGFQTTMSVLSHGLPLLAVPITSTDPQRAKRCAEVGVGLAMKPLGPFFDDYFDDRYPTFSQQTVRDAVRELLQNPRYRRQARRLREEIWSLPGPEKVVELLTELAGRRVAQLVDADG